MPPSSCLARLVNLYRCTFNLTAADEYDLAASYRGYPIRHNLTQVCGVTGVMAGVWSDLCVK